jgi:hypothetical protein
MRGLPSRVARWRHAGTVTVSINASIDHKRLQQQVEIGDENDSFWHWRKSCIILILKSLLPELSDQCHSGSLPRD